MRARDVLEKLPELLKPHKGDAMLKIEKPGIHNISAELYHADPCPEPSLSSGIANILLKKSPLHARNAHPRLNPNFTEKNSETFDLGTVAHQVFLEGDFTNIAVIDYDDWRTSAAKEARANAYLEGKTPILEKNMSRVRAMVIEAQMAAAGFGEIDSMACGRAEQTLTCKIENAWFRARLDWLQNDKKIIIDYKTTESANPDDFINRSIIQTGYDVQAAFYLRLLKELTGVEAKFIWMVQENTAPYACSFVSMGEQMLDYASRKVTHAMQLWRGCIGTDTWPSYDKQVHYADMPAWAANKAEEFLLNEEKS